MLSAPSPPLAPVEEQPLASISLKASLSLREDKGVCQMLLGVQGQAHPAQFFKISENNTIFHGEFRCR